MYYYGNGYGVYALFHVLWVVLVILFIVWLVRMARHDGYRFRNRPGGRTALDILKERYAKGEITKAEFDERRKDIE